ncbi:MAG: aldehyde ferredoxin oxidoreductase [Desulfobacterales bacterium]|nr:MAG: aldehyde ferredoxin oxidoreductase [Desulfobacterales bacterium]
MISDEFRVLVYDLTTETGTTVNIAGRSLVAGGSGLAALLFQQYGDPCKNWDDESQPLIFTIGPLTGYFPLMSKTVCSFKSSYHGEYTESHGGGRTALAMKFYNLDGLVIIGRAKRLSCLTIGSGYHRLQDTTFMKGMNTDSTGKVMRRIFPAGSGHRSILRIGPAGEIGSAMACINVDTYRHFGRMGGGATMGVKNLKGIIICGEDDFSLPSGKIGKEYQAAYKQVFAKVTDTDMMRKYHNLGTAVNLKGLNEIASLPWNNLQKTADAGIETVTGTAFADETLLRNGACGGCPVGCIHIGFIREKMQEDNRYHFHQVAYDYEPIFAAGTMLGITNTFGVLRVLDEIEKVGLDAMSGGVALAWATEALQRGILTEKETLVPLQFGDVATYRQAATYLGRGINEFYQLLGQGSLKAAARYGGEEFACVLGQEMAGYATGELFFAAQSLGFRHSHLDTGAYSYDQKHAEKDVAAAVNFLIDDEPGRVFLTSMVSCLFARKVYDHDQLATCLASVGYNTLAENIDTVAEKIRRLRWQVRIETGFSPENFSIPKRFYSVKTWKGAVDGNYLDTLKRAYGKRIMDVASPA